VSAAKDATRFLFGASYEKGSAYCQGFPVVHFEGCEIANPAYDLYGQLTTGDLTVQGEFAKTTDAWPGTFNPDIPQVAAHKVSSFSIGGKYRVMAGGTPVDVSGEWSRFTAGPSGAPWDDQDQIVMGVAAFVSPTAKLFVEYIRVNGYAPLNFISGGGGPDVELGETHSDNAVRSNVAVFGVNVAF